MPQPSSTAQRPPARRQASPAVPVERSLAKREETEQHPLVLAIEQRMPVITRMLPASMSADRFQSIVLSAVVQNPEILTCDPASVIDAVITAAREGLEPTGASGGAWLVPFYDNDVRKAQLIRDYRGIAKLLIGGGTVKRIDTSPVRTGDEFEYELGMNPRLIHKPKVGNDAEAHSYYAIAWLPEGDVKVEVMTRAQVEHIRGKSKAKDNGPWKTDFDQMGRKTVMKRLANNQLPISHEVRSQLSAEDTAEYGDAGVVISRMPATDLTERRKKIAERTARLTGGPEQPPQESVGSSSARGADQPPPAAVQPAPGAAEAVPASGVAPGPASSLDEATIAVVNAATTAGLDASWPALDQLARDALSIEPEAMTVADWLGLRDRIAGGEFAKAAAG